MGMDSLKVSNVRSTTQILDFIGDYGGFNDAMEIIFVTLGSFFSGKFLIASLAKDLYFGKKSVLPSQELNLWQLLFQKMSSQENNVSIDGKVKVFHQGD